jgi:hypothetical protein
VSRGDRDGRDSSTEDYTRAQGDLLGQSLFSDTSFGCRLRPISGYAWVLHLPPDLPQALSIVHNVTRGEGRDVYDRGHKDAFVSYHECHN